MCLVFGVRQQPKLHVDFRLLNTLETLDSNLVVKKMQIADVVDERAWSEYTESLISRVGQCQMFFVSRSK